MFQIETDYEESEAAVMVTLRAFDNTWINSRKKRRQQKLLQQKQMENSETSGPNEYSSPFAEKMKSTTVALESENGSTTGAEEAGLSDPSPQDNNCTSEEGAGSAIETGSSHKRPHSSDNAPENLKKPKLDEPSRSEYLVASLILKENDDSSEIIIEIYFIEGTGGKDAANQLLTCLKNRLKI